MADVAEPVTIAHFKQQMSFIISGHVHSDDPRKRFLAWFLDEKVLGLVHNVENNIELKLEWETDYENFLRRELTRDIEAKELEIADLKKRRELIGREV